MYRSIYIVFALCFLYLSVMGANFAYEHMSKTQGSEDTGWLFMLMACWVYLCYLCLFVVNTVIYTQTKRKEPYILVMSLLFQLIPITLFHIYS